MDFRLTAGARARKTDGHPWLDVGRWLHREVAITGLRAVNLSLQGGPGLLGQAVTVNLLDAVGYAVAQSSSHSSRHGGGADMS